MTGVVRISYHLLTHNIIVAVVRRPRPIVVAPMVRVDALHVTDPPLPTFSFSLDHLPPRCIHRRALAKMERSLTRDLDRLYWRAFAWSSELLESTSLQLMLFHWCHRSTTIPARARTGPHVYPVKATAYRGMVPGRLATRRATVDARNSTNG